MADIQDPTVGYKGEFHLHNGTALYKLVGVTRIQIPRRGNREEVEVTDLESVDWRREYLSTFYEDSEFEVGVRTRAMTDTDVLLDDAHSDSDVRAFKVVIPQNGTPFAQITGTCKCRDYDRGEITPADPIDGTATFRIVTIDAIAAYSA